MDSDKNKSDDIHESVALVIASDSAMFLPVRYFCRKATLAEIALARIAALTFLGSLGSPPSFLLAPAGLTFPWLP